MKNKSISVQTLNSAAAAAINDFRRKFSADPEIVDLFARMVCEISANEIRIASALAREPSA